MSPKKSSNTSNLTPSEPLKKTASARNILIAAGLQAAVIIFVIASLMPWVRSRQLDMHIGSAVIQVEVANTEQERQKGLSAATSLAKNHGMLFVFSHDSQWAMWMKDMKMPIDIVWLNAYKKVVHVEAHVDPASYPAYFAPPESARYVLELASGGAAEAGILPGVVAQFDDVVTTK
jgi:uncharacterized membrane protein (UPF0127 family)